MSLLKKRFCPSCKDLRPSSSFKDSANIVRTSCEACRAKSIRRGKKQARASSQLTGLEAYGLAREQMGQYRAVAVLKKEKAHIMWRAFYAAKERAEQASLELNLKLMEDTK